MKKIVFILMMFVAVLYSCSSQKTVTKTVTGVVFIEDDPSPLPGATIFVKGSKERFTRTDIDGNFEIEVKKSETLIISYVSTRSREIKITDENNYIITLSVWTL